MYIRGMDKLFRWDIAKNEKLLKERGISFEMVSKATEEGGLLDIVNHPSRSNQQLLVVKIRDYAVLVPFVQTEDYVFFKTAFPSRKFTEKYQR